LRYSCEGLSSPGFKNSFVSFIGLFSSVFVWSITLLLLARLCFSLGCSGGRDPYNQRGNIGRRNSLGS
jgi:hypothetical protein